MKNEIIRGFAPHRFLEFRGFRGFESPRFFHDGFRTIAFIHGGRSGGDIFLIALVGIVIVGVVCHSAKKTP